MSDPLDPPSHDPRDDTESAFDFEEAFETVSGEFVGSDYTSGSTHMDLHIRVTVEDAKRAYRQIGGRAVLTLEKPR